MPMPTRDGTNVPVGQSENRADKGPIGNKVPSIPSAAKSGVVALRRRDKDISRWPRPRQQLGPRTSRFGVAVGFYLPSGCALVSVKSSGNASPSVLSPSCAGVAATSSCPCLGVVGSTNRFLRTREEDTISIANILVSDMPFNPILCFR